MNNYLFRINIRGSVKALTREDALRAIRSNLHLSLSLHDAVDDVRIETELNPLNPLYPVEGG